ncbi:MAG: hypothetical protein RIB01_15355 [Balneola sp.]
MTTYKTVTATWEELDYLFENATKFSIRYFNKIAPNTWDVTIRFTGNREMEQRMRKCQTTQELMNIEKDKTTES